MSEIQTGMSLYDMAKIEAMHASMLTEEEVQIKKNLLCDYISKNKNKYYMLLCNERRDYTLFNLEKVSSNIMVANDIIECLVNRDFNILSIEKDIAGGGIEIWVRGEAPGPTAEPVLQAFAYYFFPYDNGVIEY